MSNQKIVKYKKPFQPHVATMIFIIIVLYISFVAWNYFNKEHISIYEVNETSIADDSTITGFILRNETVVYAEEGGYVNFYHADQSKVAKNEVVYTIDSSGEVSDLLNNMESDSSLSHEDIVNMRQVIDDFYTNFNLSGYYNVNDFHYNVENTIFEQSRDNLYSDLKKQISANHLDSNFTKSRTSAAGIISYSIDGFEDTSLEDINPELFEQSASVERKQLSSSEKIEQNTPVYKLVTDQDWKIVIPLSEDLQSKIGDSSSVRVTVKKDNISFNAELSLQTNAGTVYGVLSTSRYMGRYLNDRFIDIELNLNSASGLKIPNSSVLTKNMALVPEELTTTGGDEEEQGVIKITYDKNGESTKEFTSLEDCTVTDGNYYVNESILKPGDTIVNPSNNEAYTIQDEASVEGVYCVNTGYCQFKKIEKIYENNEYTIISSDTTGGLSNFDHIVVNPDQINENDFVE